MLEDRKKTFNGFSEEYDRYRPNYPAKMFEDIIEYSSLEKHDEIFEIGCGTGKATQGFTDLGFGNITCAEFGDKLAEFTRIKFSDIDTLRVIHGDFEKMPVDSGKYRLVFCATAFHFLNQDIVYPKIHEMLAENGSLVIFWNMSVDDGSREYAAIRQAYLRYAPDVSTFTKDSSETAIVEIINNRCREINDTGLYTDISVNNYVRKIPHTGSHYISLLRTHSPNALLEEETQRKLYSDIESIILENGDIFEEKMLTTCYMMRKK